MCGLAWCVSHSTSRHRARFIMLLSACGRVAGDVQQVGSFTDNILADAIVKGIPGFNTTLAYEAIYQVRRSLTVQPPPCPVACHDVSRTPQDAFVVPPSSTVSGRSCLNSYTSLGYIASDAGCSEEVSRTLNYYLSDVAIAGAATTLGLHKDADALLARASKYTELFEVRSKVLLWPHLTSISVTCDTAVQPTTGFFRSKTSAGQFVEPFDEFQWGGSYTEVREVPALLSSAS